MAAAQVTATPDFQVGRNEERAAAVSAAFEAHYPRTLELLEREFPRDHADLIAAVAEIGGGEGTPAQLLLAAADQMTALRRKYADRVLFAPSFSHSIMLGLLADFYDRVFATEGVSVCGRFAHDGSAILFELGLSAKYAGNLDRQSLAFFEAVVQAIEAPDQGEAVRPEDWGVVIGAMIAAGAPERYAEAISGGRPNDPDLCPAYAALFRISGLLDAPAGIRTRADFAKNLAGY